MVPNFVTVEENQMAVFNCTYSCDVMKEHSHNVYWHVGDVRNSRGFFYRTASLFSKRTGLYVEAEDMSTCDKNLGGTIKHQLRINASSLARWNATAVQCVAVRTNAKQVDFYSHFALLIVTPKKMSATGAPAPTTKMIAERMETTTGTTEMIETTMIKEGDESSKFIEFLMNGQHIHCQ